MSQWVYHPEVPVISIAASTCTHSWERGDMRREFVDIKAQCLRTQEAFLLGDIRDFTVFLFLEM